MNVTVSIHKRVPAGYLRLSGEDGAAFLNSQFSGDLRQPEPGLCTYGLWLDAKGKVQADGWVLCREAESFDIVSMGVEGAIMKEKLERHIIADDVAIELLGEASLLMLQGEGVEQAVEALLGSVPKTGCFTESSSAVCYAGRRSREPHFDICYMDPSAADAAIKELEAAGAKTVGLDVIELARIDAGFPAIPQELGAGDLPGEANLVGEAVCTTKGCFLGQESILRMHNLGRARRGLYAVSGKGLAPSVPSSLTVAGEERAPGELRSAYGTDSGWIGVAMLKLDRMEMSMQCEGQSITVGHAMGSA